MIRVRKFWFISLLALILLGAIVWSDIQTQKNFVPVPNLPEGTIQLRVAMLETPNFPTLTEAEWDQFLQVAREAAQEHLGVEVEFIGRDRLSLNEVFQRLDAAMPEEHKARIADFRNNAVDWPRMQTIIREGMVGYEEYMPKSYSMVRDVEGSSFPELTGDTIEEQADSFAEALTVLLQEKVEAFRTTVGADYLGGAERAGLPGYNEWIYWDAIPALNLSYDVYLTNQPIVSVEYALYPAHVILRGGVTVGTTSAGSKTQFGSATFLSVHSFLDTSDTFVALRGGHSYTREEAIRLSGKYFTHELGHLLFHYGHPWNRPECVMKPAELLRFREWESGLNAAECQIGSGPVMTPGSVPFPVQAFTED